MLTGLSLLTLVAFAAPDEAMVNPDPTPAPRAVVRSEARVSIPLKVRRRPKVAADPISARIRITVSKRDASRAEAALKKALSSSFCPDVARSGRDIYITCQTRQLEVALRRGKKRRGYRLDITKLRGAPYIATDDQLPRIFYDPARLKLGAACPGDTPASKGECALHRGDVKKAAIYFKEAIGGPRQDMAALRLGDIALQSGNIKLAAGWYHRVGRTGPYSRLAKARTCQLQGTCFDPIRPGNRYDPLDPVALPEPLYTEVALRRARNLTYAGKPNEAVKALVNFTADHRHDVPCDYAPRLCHRIALEALRESVDLSPSPDALVFYGLLPDHLKGPYAHEMARLASDTAFRLGAPHYAASLLAASTGLADRAELEDHLARCVELYISASDPARARIVHRYAKGRFPERMEEPRWVAINARLSAFEQGHDDAHLPPLETPSELERAQKLIESLAPQASDVEDATGESADAKSGTTADKAAARG